MDEKKITISFIPATSFQDELLTNTLETFVTMWAFASLSKHKKNKVEISRNYEIKSINNSQ